MRHSLPPFWLDSLVELLIGNSALESSGSLWLLSPDSQQNVCLLLQHGSLIWAAPSLPSPQAILALASLYPQILPLSQQASAQLAACACKPSSSFNSVLYLLCDCCGSQSVKDFLFQLALDSLQPLLSKPIRSLDFESALPKNIDWPYFQSFCPETDSLLLALIDTEIDLLTRGTSPETVARARSRASRSPGFPC